MVNNGSALNAPALKRKAGLRSSGRPPKTSREAIIACAIAILAKEPGAGISLNRIAKEIDITAMSIYNYFGNRDELVQAVVDQLVAGIAMPQEAGAPWQRRIVVWADTMRAHFKRHPYLIHLLNWEGHTSIEWVKHCLFVTDVLEEAGLRGDALARASLWVSRNVMSNIHVEISALEESQPSAADIAALPARWQEKLQDIFRLTERDRYYDDSFRYTVERTLDALAFEINQANLGWRPQTAPTGNPRPSPQPSTTATAPVTVFFQENIK